MRPTQLVLLCALCASGTAAQADTVVLYQQSFEAPVGYIETGGDFNIAVSVNALYTDQPPGFSFAQAFTVETLRVGGTGAFLGNGYRDPQGKAGQYLLGMLSDAQNDLLSLSFSAGTRRFLNFALDVSSIDLDRQGGPFVPLAGAAPVYRISLFDNPTGATGLAGNGVLLDSATVTGTVAPNKFTLDWTHAVVGLDAQASSNGNVTIQIDLLSGGYGGMDNFLVAASDIKGAVPEPQAWALWAAGLFGLGAFARRRRA